MRWIVVLCYGCRMDTITDRETLIASMNDEEFMALKRAEFPAKFAEIQARTAKCEAYVLELERRCKALLKAAKAERRDFRAYEKRVRKEAIEAGWLEE